MFISLNQMMYGYREVAVNEFNYKALSFYLSF